MIAIPREGLKPVEHDERISVLRLNDCYPA